MSRNTRKQTEQLVRKVQMQNSKQWHPTQNGWIQLQDQNNEFQAPGDGHNIQTGHIQLSQHTYQHKHTQKAQDIFKHFEQENQRKKCPMTTNTTVTIKPNILSKISIMNHH